MATVMRVAQFGFEAPLRKEWSDLFYAAARAHNAMMDAMLAKELCGVEPESSIYRIGREAAPELGSEAISGFLQAYSRREFEAWRRRRYRERVDCSLPYRARAPILSLRSHRGERALFRLGEGGGWEVRVPLWPGGDERNLVWHPVYPFGPNDVRLAMEAVKHGQMTLAWSPKAKNQKRKWRLLVPCEVEVRDRARGNLVAGVDLGVCHLAVVSIPELRKCCYFSRHDLPHRQRWLDEKRRRAQQAGGPQASARWRDRERAWTDTAIQETARRIVAWLARFEGAGIVQLEDLNGLSEGATRRDVGGATARMLKRFPYGKLGDHVQQAAEAEGFEVRRVPAAYTSQTCSRCGRLGRRRARRFVCDACGLALCADLNAANNIAKAQAIA